MKKNESSVTGDDPGCIIWFSTSDDCMVQPIVDSTDRSADMMRNTCRVRLGLKACPDALNKREISHDQCGLSNIRRCIEVAREIDDQINCLRLSAGFLFAVSIARHGEHGEHGEHRS